MTTFEQQSKRWIVIARSTGDGSSDYGFRVWSETFFSRKAAGEAFDFLDATPDIRVAVIEDGADR